LILVVVGLTTAGVVLWYLLSHLRQIALEVLEEQYPELEFQIGSLKLRSLQQIEAREISVRDREIDPENSKIEIERIQLITEFSPDGLGFKKLLVRKPNVRINVTGDSVPIIGRFLKKKESKSDRTIGLIKIDDGRISFSIGEYRIKTNFAITALSIPDLNRNQINVSLDNIVVQDPLLLLEEHTCALSFNLIQHGDDRLEIDNGKLLAANAEYDFECDLTRTGDRISGGIDFKTTRFSLNDVAFLYQDHLPYQVGFDGKVTLNGHAWIDAGETLTIAIDGKARISQAAVGYSLQSKVLAFTGVEVSADWRLNPLIGIFADGGLEADCALFIDRINYGGYEVHNTSSRVNIQDGRIVLDNVIGRVYGGRILGNGNIDFLDDSIEYKLSLGIIDFDTEELIKALEPKDVYVSGLANGSVNWQGRVGTISRLNMELETEPQGGLIKIENIEKFLNSLPGGRETVANMQQSLGAHQWKTFIKTMKNYDYDKGSFKLDIDPDSLELTLGFRFSSKDPNVGERNLKLVIHDIDQQLIPAIPY